MDIAKNNAGGQIPLAWRMKPRRLDEYVGQKHLLGEGKILQGLIKRRNVASLIFYGPPGCGKTALANVIANELDGELFQLNGVSSGVSDLRKVFDTAKKSEKKTILFIDEIHRFNKSQQSALLPEIEQGVITFIGASTQNPYFAIIPALASRTHILPLHPFTDEDLKTILSNALGDKERGLGSYNIQLQDGIVEYIIVVSENDARKMLNLLELAFFTAKETEDGNFVITLEDLKEITGRTGTLYDKADDHYDTISAYIKSVRGSDPDASLYWLAKMIASGEDPMFIARRLVILASEDIGNADPHALLIAVAAMEAVNNIGMPEGRIPLSQATIYLSLAPKSNASYLAIDAALKDITERRVLAVPPYLRDTHSFKEKEGKEGKKGGKYEYPHDFKDHFVTQDYLGEKRSFFHPTDQGFERYLLSRIVELWNYRRR